MLALVLQVLGSLDIGLFGETGWVHYHPHPPLRSSHLLSPVAREFGTASRGFVVTSRASFSLGVDSNRLQADPDLLSVGGWVLMNICWVGFSFVIAQYYNFNRNLLYWYQVPSSSLEIAKEVFTSALYILSSDIPEGSLSSHMRRIWSSLLLGSLHPF